MKRPFLLTTLCCLLLATPGQAAISPSGQTTPTPADIDKAAMRLAQELNGVLRNCPASYASIGTPDKRCVGLSGDVDTVRGQLSALIGGDLFGVWRSRDDQRTVFNWIKTPSGTVYLRIAKDQTTSDRADESGPARSLVYLDAPTVPAAAISAPAPDTSTPAPAANPDPKPPETSAPAANPPVESQPVVNPPAANQPTASQAAAPKGSLAPLAFGRTLSLQSPPLSGPDVLAAQNRLIALTSGSRGGRGEGTYSPSTAAAVRDFQIANGLKATGELDRATWNTLFAPDAKRFRATGP